MHVQVRPRLLMLAFAAAALVAALLTPLAGTSKAEAASFTPKCVPAYPVAPPHQPSATSLAGLSTTADTSMPEVVARPHRPKRPKWDGDDYARGLMQVGDTVAVGGWFDAVKTADGKKHTRHNVFAFNVKTGALTNFAPNVDGAVYSVTPSCTGTWAYLAGNFSHVNGVARKNIAKVSMKDGHVDPNWEPKVNGEVAWVSIMHDHLVISGTFTTVNGVARSNIASVNQTGTGALNSWLNLSVTGRDPAGPQRVYQVVPNHAGTYAVMIGNFNAINGASHRRIAVLTLGDSHATLTAWNTSKTASKDNANSSTDCSSDVAMPERGVAWQPNDLRFFTAATGGAHANSLCDALTAWDASSAAALSNPKALPQHINYTGGDTLTAAAATNVAVVTTGHERWANNPPIWPLQDMPLGTPCNASRVAGHKGYGCQNPPSIGGASVSRPGIIEVSASTMVATAYNPGRSRQVAMHNYMMLTPSGMFIASDGNYFSTNGKKVSCNDLCLVRFVTPLK